MTPWPIGRRRVSWVKILWVFTVSAATLWESDITFRYYFHIYRDISYFLPPIPLFSAGIWVAMRSSSAQDSTQWLPVRAGSAPCQQIKNSTSTFYGRMGGEHIYNVAASYSCQTRQGPQGRDRDTHHRGCAGQAHI